MKNNHHTKSEKSSKTLEKVVHLGVGRKDVGDVGSREFGVSELAPDHVTDVCVDIDVGDERLHASNYDRIIV